MPWTLKLAKGDQKEHQYVFFTYKDYEIENLKRDNGRNPFNVEVTSSNKDITDGRCVGVILERPYCPDSAYFESPGHERLIGKHTEWIVLPNLPLRKGQWFTGFAEKVDKLFAENGNEPLYLVTNTYLIEEILSRKDGNRRRWRFNTFPPLTAHENMFMIGKSREVFEGVEDIEVVTKVRNGPHVNLQMKGLLDLFRQRYYGNGIEKLKADDVFGVLVLLPTTIPTQARAEEKENQAKVVDTAKDVQKVTQNAQDTGDVLKTEVVGASEAVANSILSDEPTTSVPGLAKIEHSESMKEHDILSVMDRALDETFKSAQESLRKQFAKLLNLKEEGDGA